MQYQKMLNKIIAEKGYNGAEIIRRCKEINVNIDKGAFSKYLNGKAVPTEEKSRAIAKVCDVDERRLVIEGYLEEAPKEIREMFEAIKVMQIIGTKNFINLQDIIDVTIKKIEELVAKEPLSDTVIDILDSKDKFVNFMNNEVIYTKINDKLDFRVSFLNPEGFKIADNGMSPLVQKNDRVIVETKNSYESSDIILIKHEKGMIARYIYKVNNTIRLVPISKRYKEIITDKDKIKIIGKICSITRKI